jgi:hypothetical protein
MHILTQSSQIFFAKRTEVTNKESKGLGTGFGDKASSGTSTYAELERVSGGFGEVVENCGESARSSPVDMNSPVFGVSAKAAFRGRYSSARLRIG